MKELRQIREAVITALKEQGLQALSAYPDQRAELWDGPVAAVAVDTVQSKAAGFYDYLGEIYDEESGTVRERYGKRMEGSVSIELRAPTTAECEEGCEQAEDALLSGCPQGLRLERAALGNDAGLVGAARYWLDRDAES